ncbi:hypothetical protein SteCoe_13529 [Stentor coeruleus]|uniref:LITAF domain-containing protein n=1 Tax=Stentor coeruleus TaxID=5963 RepID=A0A1R2C878_9CILI|nr:hypothetical protein SteCoe_13529 [Stentor coeruleus]
MSYNTPDNVISPAELTTTQSIQGLQNPELSEEPAFRDNKHNSIEKPQKTQEPHQSTEMNTSSLQLSTQQSVNFKRSFSLISPKRSVQLTPHLISNKLRDKLGRTLTLRLNQKLKHLEEESNLPKTQESQIYPLPLNDDTHFVDSPKPALENYLALEGNDDNEIPHLRWCASCKGEVKTEIEYVNNRKTFWASVGIFMTGGVLGCFLLPYMTNSCKGVKVVCHKCRKALA